MPPFDELPLQRTVLQNGIEIHHAEAGSGTPLVFVHGGFGDWTAWQPQWADFTAQFRCITYSRRYSSPNRNPDLRPDHSVRAEAEDLLALLAVWQAAPAVLVGTSYGAYTALQAALMAPDRVLALALTEPPILPLADRMPQGLALRQAFERDVLHPAARAFADGNVEAAVSRLTQGINGSGPGEAATPAGRERRLRNAQAMRALSLSSQAYPPLPLDDLQALRVPTLLLTGEHTLPVHRAIT